MEVARNFLATFAPFEIDSLPAVCQPGRIRAGADVIAYASRLVRHRCADGHGVEYAIHRLTTFFSCAATRIGELHEAARPPSHHTSA